MLNFKKYDLKRYNISLLVVVTTLIAIGVFLIKQVRPGGLQAADWFDGGLFIAVIVSFIDYHFVCQFYIVLYINPVLLVMVKVTALNTTMPDVGLI